MSDDDDTIVSAKSVDMIIGQVVEIVAYNRKRIALLMGSQNGATYFSTVPGDLANVNGVSNPRGMQYQYIGQQWIRKALDGGAAMAAWFGIAPQGADSLYVIEVCHK